MKTLEAWRFWVLPIKRKRIKKKGWLTKGGRGRGCSCGGVWGQDRGKEENP